MGRQTILFVDEIHRFNKAQQDAFLPHVRAGTITLVGATTENPSFELNHALLSRMRVFVLYPLTQGDIAAVLDRALLDEERGLGALSLKVDDDAREIISALCRRVQPGPRVSGEKGVAAAYQFLSGMRAVLHRSATNGGGLRVISDKCRPTGPPQKRSMRTCPRRW
ncbi:MAG TPA: hypothetical protein VII30_02965 [Gemmatimonadaceae bacterium]